MEQKQLILNENLTKVMWTMALPAIAAMVLFGLNAFMDTVYIGQLMNETALAGVALAYPMTSVLMGLGVWAGTGGANLLSIALGDEDVDTQKKILPNTTLFAAVSTLVFAVPAYFFAEPLVWIMGGREQVLVEGVVYFKTTLLAAPVWVYGLALNMIIRGEGKMKTAAMMMAYGLMINLVLTPIFISWLTMGVEGAAWATNIGMMIYSLVGFTYFKKKRASFQADIQSLAYAGDVFVSIMKMGFPGFIMSVMGLVQAVVVFNAIVSVGNDNDLAFFAAANRILLFLMTPLFGLMRSLQPVLGINFGARQYDRVKDSFKLFTKTGFYMVVPFWVILTLFPEESLRIALPDLQLNPQDLFNIRIYMLVLPLLPVVFMALTFFPAIKEEKYGSIIGMARQLVFYVPVMMFLPKYLGLHWVYYGATLIDVLVTLWIVYVVWQLFKKLDRSKEEKNRNPIKEEVEYAQLEQQDMA